MLKTKKSLFDWMLNTKSEFGNFKVKAVYLNVPREDLLKKISLRTNLMFKRKCV